VALAGACTASSPPPAGLPTSTAPAGATVANSATQAPAVRDEGREEGREAGSPSGPPTIDPADILFPGALGSAPGVGGCLGIRDPGERARCLFALRYADDRESAAIATELFERSGSVAGVQVEQDMDGGFRGRIHLVPELPVGPQRRHLAWVVSALRDFDGYFAAMGAAHPVRYRTGPLALRFFRSVGRTTPSAYAEGWSVSYNVAGSLFGSADAVRETLFHEIFHLNDADHGDWSARALGADYAGIVARCGTRVACLRPYAPGDTMVRGGTYYAFQPENGEAVHEYAAELALRWYREQRLVRHGEPLGRPAFKCGPRENARAWAALVEEFFGGADRVPPCQSAR
jgi:hypothetical protein